MEVKKFSNGFEYVEVKNSVASAKIALQGGHIFHYAHNKKEPILWLSDESVFEVGTAIRGGIPICWPSFGMNNSDLPQHGFARVSMWNLVCVNELNSNTTEVILNLKETQESLKLWDYKFDLELKITISDTLTLEMTTTNLDEKSFKLTQAFHSYFKISDITNISVNGLDSKLYFDALSSYNIRQNGDITFSAELDRVYQNVESPVVLKDTNAEVKLTSQGSSSVVVWNPWIEKCSRMSGMSNEAYKEFVCIETANAFEDFRTLGTRESHILKVTIS